MFSDVHFCNNHSGCFCVWGVCAVVAAGTTAAEESQSRETRWERGCCRCSVGEMVLVLG